MISSTLTFDKSGVSKENGDVEFKNVKSLIGLDYKELKTALKGVKNVKVLNVKSNKKIQIGEKRYSVEDLVI